MPENPHTCAGSHVRALFCTQCGKVLDPEGLRSVRLQGFSGHQSLSPAVEHFWHTGDPEVFSPDPATRQRAFATPPAT